MTTKELQERISYRWKGYGHYEVTIKYRNKFYSCTSHNSLAVDRINCNEWEENKQEIGFYTYKGALLALYNECKRQNRLGEYNY